MVENNNESNNFENVATKKGCFFDKHKSSFTKRLANILNCKKHHKFVELNDTVSYGISGGSTLHIHLIPKDISSTLRDVEEFKKCELDFIDALDKIKEIMKKINL